MASPAGPAVAALLLLLLLAVCSSSIRGAAAADYSGNAVIDVRDHYNDDADDDSRTPGSIAYPGQFPWHVAVVNRDSGKSPNFAIQDLLGGGALISNYFVLTTASVVAAAAEPEAVDVTLGAAWLTAAGGGGTTMKTVFVAQHPQWDSATAENDIATLKLEHPVLETDRIAPVRLPASFYVGATYAGQTLSVSSWGSADQHNTQAFLSVYNVDVIRNRDCQSKQGHSSKALPWTKLCAVSGAYPNPCQHDVGSPAVFLEPDGVYTLVGVVSSDTQCDAKKPAKLTRVTELLDWIKENSNVKIE